MTQNNCILIVVLSKQLRMNMKQKFNKLFGYKDYHNLSLFSHSSTVISSSFIYLLHYHCAADNYFICLRNKHEFEKSFHLTERHE